LTVPTAAKIRSLTRRQLVYYLEQGLKGDELLMKEVWEECATDADVVTAKHELEEVVGFLRDRESAESKIGPSADELTARQVESFSTYPLAFLLDELVMCTVRYNLGDLAADERRIATAVLDRLAALGVAHKDHRAGCEIWLAHRLCRCPWRVPS
jgi:hypothetical protein